MCRGCSRHACLLVPPVEGGGRQRCACEQQLKRGLTSELRLLSELVDHHATWRRREERLSLRRLGPLRRAWPRHLMWRVDLRVWRRRPREWRVWWTGQSRQYGHSDVHPFPCGRVDRLRRDLRRPQARRPPGSTGQGQGDRSARSAQKKLTQQNFGRSVGFVSKFSNDGPTIRRSPHDPQQPSYMVRCQTLNLQAPAGSVRVKRWLRPCCA